MTATHQPDQTPSSLGFASIASFPTRARPTWALPSARAAKQPNPWRGVAAAHATWNASFHRPGGGDDQVHGGQEAAHLGVRPRQSAVVFNEWGCCSVISLASPHVRPTGECARAAKQTKSNSAAVEHGLKAKVENKRLHGALLAPG